MAQLPQTAQPPNSVNLYVNYMATISDEYYPLGKYIVRAPGICGGRPTFKYTRLEPSFILAQLSLGRTVEEVVAAYQPSRVSVEGVYEAIKLANQAFMTVHRTPVSYKNDAHG